MLGNRNGRRPRWPLERRWETASQPLEARWVLPDHRRAPGPAGSAPLDFCWAMRRLCTDIADHSPALAHLDVSRILISFTPSRNRSRYGLQARVTPMRFSNGARLRVGRGTTYGVQRYILDGREILYVLTFCLPRFLDQSFHEKMVTVFHELYHISPAFDGDIRRLGGRYSVHSHSQRSYDELMAKYVEEYLATHPSEATLAFLRPTYAELWRQHGGIYGVVVPRPKLVPMAHTLPAASRESRIPE
jgi:predicted metallopeptidase